MNSERAYRNSVLPLSVLMVLGGLILAVCAWGFRVPVTSAFPFVESETLNRHLFGVLSLYCVGIGMGLFFRHRVGWYALLIFLGVGMLLPALTALDARIVAARGYEFPMIGSFLNGAIGVGLYFVLRPAFNRDDGELGPDQTENTIGGSERI